MTPAKRKYLRKPEKKEQIEELVMCYARERYSRFNVMHGMTMRMIARELNYSPSSKLLNLLYEMVDEGRLVMQVQPFQSGVTDVVTIFFHPRYTPPKLFDD